MNWNKIMNVFCSVIVGLSLLILPKTATADMIWAPNNDFLNENFRDCEQFGRGCIANGMFGRVILYENPESHKKVKTCKNGTTFYVSHTYTDRDGTIWAVVESEDKKTGWIPMDQLVVYDNISFREEHESELKEFEGHVHDYVPEPPLQLWSYPGSGVIINTYTSIGYPVLYQVNDTYTDENGRLWASINYWHDKEGWICLSDPANDNIPSFGVEAAVAKIWPYSDTTKEVLNRYDNSLMILIVVLVTATVAVTWVMIRVLWKKNDTKKG